MPHFYSIQFAMFGAAYLVPLVILSYFMFLNVFYCYTEYSYISRIHTILLQDEPNLN